jgi:hypothetical protein
MDRAIVVPLRTSRPKDAGLLITGKFRSTHLMLLFSILGKKDKVRGHL